MKNTITSKDLDNKFFLDLFNKAEDYLIDKYNIVEDSDEDTNKNSAKLWEKEFGVKVDMTPDGFFGDMVFPSEEEYTMFLLRFG